MASSHIGIQLIERGWSQGCLLPMMGACMTVLTCEQDPITADTAVNESASTASGSTCWTSRSEEVEGDCLIVVSQDCDIQKPPDKEPYVEVVRAFWSSDRELIHQARLNSVRYCLLQRRIGSDGVEEGLIADAAARMSVTKASLMFLVPSPVFDGSDKLLASRFRQWLGSRYDRPAIENEIVKAVQKPIVEAVSSVSKKSEYQPVLEAIDEVRYMIQNDSIPYAVELVFLRYDESPLPAQDEVLLGRLVTKLGEGLSKTGKAELVHWDMLSARQLSYYDALHMERIPLDQYSLESE